MSMEFIETLIAFSTNVKLKEELLKIKEGNLKKYDEPLNKCKRQLCYGCKEVGYITDPDLNMISKRKYPHYFEFLNDWYKPAVRRVVGSLTD